MGAVLWLFLVAVGTGAAPIPASEVEQIFSKISENLKNVVDQENGKLDSVIESVDEIKQNIIFLMPHLEMKERPIITNAYARLLDIEKRIQTAIGGTLGNLANTISKNGNKMVGKFNSYPEKYRSSLRTMKALATSPKRLLENLEEENRAALTDAQTVFVSLGTFKGMMKNSKNLSPDMPSSFEIIEEFTKLGTSSILGTLELKQDKSLKTIFKLVKESLPSILNIGRGLYEIEAKPDLRSKVDESIRLSTNLVDDIKDLIKRSVEYQTAMGNFESEVNQLKEQVTTTDVTNLDTMELEKKFSQLETSAARLARYVAITTSYKINNAPLPEPSTTTTTTTTTSTTTASTTTTTSTTTSTSNANTTY